MSFSIGWKNKDTVFIIADSAVVQNKVLDTKKEKSSFNEEPVDIGSYTSQEGLLKIFNFGKVIVSFAGDVMTAKEILRIFKNSINNGIDILKSFEMAIDSCSPFLPKIDVEFIIGFCDNNKPSLYIYKGNELKEKHSKDDFPFIGNINYFNSGIGSIIEPVHRLKYDTNEKAITTLVKYTSLAQSNHLFYDTMEKGVGGAFFGVMTHNGKSDWLKNIRYIIHNKNGDILNIISIYEIENVLIVASRKEEMIKYFIDDLNSQRLINDIHSWLKMWKNEIQNYTKNWELEYCIFLNKDHQFSNIVKSKNFLSNKFFRINVEENGFKLDIHNDFKKFYYATGSISSFNVLYHEDVED